MYVDSYAQSPHEWCFNTPRCCIGCRSCFFVMMRSRRDSMTSLPHNWSQLHLSTPIVILTRQWVFTRVPMNHWYVCVYMWVSVCLCLYTCVSVCLCVLHAFMYYVCFSPHACTIHFQRRGIIALF